MTTADNDHDTPQDGSVVEGGDTTRRLGEDDVTRAEVGIELLLVGQTPHNALFILIQALYQKKAFLDLLAEKGQYIVVVDPTCRMVFKQNQFKISRRDIDTQGAPSAKGSYKQFSYEEQFERYKQKKLSEDFREYHEMNNKLLLELGRVTLIDLMEYARTDCLETLRHATEEQAKQLAYAHLYELHERLELVSKLTEKHFPFYSDPS